MFVTRSRRGPGATVSTERSRCSMVTTRSGRSSISSVHASGSASGRDPVFAHVAEQPAELLNHTRCSGVSRHWSSDRCWAVTKERWTAAAPGQLPECVRVPLQPPDAPSWPRDGLLRGCSNSPAGQRSHSKLVQDLSPPSVRNQAWNSPTPTSDSACTSRAWSALHRTAPGELPARMGPVKWIPQKCGNAHLASGITSWVRSAIPINNRMLTPQLDTSRGGASP